MFEAVMRVQWQRMRWMVLVCALAVLALPWYSVISTQGINADWRMGDLLYRQLQAGSRAVMFPMIAAILGFLLGVSAWSADRQVKFVYAFTLPIPRWYYTLLQIGMGVLCIVGTGIVFWIGANLRLAFVELPPVLHAYPSLIAVRFVLAALLAYAASFALASLDERKSITLVLVLLLGGIAAVAALGSFGFLETAPVRWATDLIIGRFGILSAFIGNWRLVDL